MPETEQQKRDRILRTERSHGEPPAGLAATIPVEKAPGEPIDAPFHTDLAFHTKWFAPRGTTPTSVVIHCTAATNPASSTAAFFASPSDSGSTQAVADDDEGFTCVPDDAVCAGAPPFNQEGLHIEQPGLVTWTRDVWLSHMDDLRRVAYWTAQKCHQYGIPVVLLHTADLVRLGEKARGITYHWAISEAFHQSTHDDPGPNFPWDVFMALVQQFYDGGGDPDMSFTEGWAYRRDHPDAAIPKGKDTAFNDGWRAQDRLTNLEEKVKAGGGTSGTAATKVELAKHVADGAAHRHGHGGPQAIG